jgi:hypothetical protein
VAKIKQRQRSIVLNTQYAYGLLGNSVFALANSLGDNNVLVSGDLPNLMGNPAHRLDFLPDNGENLVGCMFGKAALIIAIAPPAQLMAGGEGDIVERRIITEPVSGLSALYTRTAAGAGTMTGELQILEGHVVGQPAAYRLVSAA